MSRDLHLPGRSVVRSTHGMAATSMPIATLTALDVLRAGGNALDAAVAAVAVLGVVEPQSTGIGGDCFCLYAPAGTGSVVALNGSGRAAAGASIDFFERAGISEFEVGSPHCVTIPGAVSAWETLLAAHGRKGLDELLQPAIALAEGGWPVHGRVAHDWAANVDKLRAGGADAYLPGGAAPQEGDVFASPALAETLRRIARHGARGFYEGPVAADIVATLRARGGVQTEEDFSAGATAAMFVEPISGKFRGYDVVQCPPNGSGIIVLMLLALLERLGPAPDGPLGVQRMHRQIEAARLVYRDRDAFVADPAFTEVPPHLLSADYLDGLAALIRPDRALAELPPAGSLPAHKDTVYLCVVDRDGNACSFINSLFMGFGGGIFAAESGVMLHNRGFSFRLQRGHPNGIAPGKRPMHTILPGMLMQGGRAVMPYGVMGGHFQVMGQAWHVSNMLDYGLDVQQSLDLPRVFPFAGKVEAERGVPAEALAGLAALGHDVEPIDSPHGGGQAIWIDHATGTLAGGSDPRKDGMALGY
jgi:gamma-glutamyltranspeptidase/glutathione hydrolase